MGAIRQLHNYQASGPQLGVHGSDYDLDGAGTSPSSVTFNTQASGSSLIVPTLGQFTNYNAPTDNKGNTFSLLQTSGYPGGAFPGFGMELYGVANAAGGSSHTVQFVKVISAVDETTLIAIEVKGRTIQQSNIVTRAAAGAGVALTSSGITTTGPALLVSIWAGDGNFDLADQTCNVEAGWTMVESLFLGNTAYVQAAAAVKSVSGAGTYTCAWTPVLNQGAIIAMVAVQA
jgi:hypothetical protein